MDEERNVDLILENLFNLEIPVSKQTFSEMSRYRAELPFNFVYRCALILQQISRIELQPHEVQRMELITNLMSATISTKLFQEQWITNNQEEKKNIIKDLFAKTLGNPYHIMSQNACFSLSRIATFHLLIMEWLSFFDDMKSLIFSESVGDGYQIANSIKLIQDVIDSNIITPNYPKFDSVTSFIYSLLLYDWKSIFTEDFESYSNIQINVLKLFKSSFHLLTKFLNLQNYCTQIISFLLTLPDELSEYTYDILSLIFDNSYRIISPINNKNNFEPLNMLCHSIFEHVLNDINNNNLYSIRFMKRISEIEYEIINTKNSNYISNHFILGLYKQILPIFMKIIIENDLNEEEEQIINEVTKCLKSFIKTEPQKLIQEISDLFRMNIIGNEQQKYLAIKVLNCSTNYCSIELPKNYLINIFDCITESQFYTLKKSSLSLIYNLLKRFQNIIDESDINSVFTILNKNIIQSEILIKESFKFMNKFIQTQNINLIYEQIVSILSQTNNNESFYIYPTLIKCLNNNKNNERINEIIQLLFDKLNDINELEIIFIITNVLIEIFHIIKDNINNYITSIINFIKNITNINKIELNDENNSKFYFDENILLLLIEISQYLFANDNDFTEKFINYLFQSQEIIFNNQKILFLSSQLLSNLCLNNPEKMYNQIELLQKWFSNILSDESNIFYDSSLLLNIFSDIINGFKDKSEPFLMIFFSNTEKICLKLMNSNGLEINFIKNNIESIFRVFLSFVMNCKLPIEIRYLIQNYIISLIKEMKNIIFSDENLICFVVMFFDNFYNNNETKQRIKFIAQQNIIKELFIYAKKVKKFPNFDAKVNYLYMELYTNE